MSSDRAIPFGTKLAFGVGQTAEGLKNTAFAAFTLFYFVQVLQMPGDVVGIALMIALLFDAFTDPMAGSLSDRTHSRFGRRHPYMYASAIPLAVSFYLLFSPPAWLIEGYGTAGLFWWLLVFAILSRGAMTLYHVPHMALGAELTENFVERTSIVAHRQIFNAVGIGLTYAIGFGYFLSDANGGRTNPEAYTPMALVFSAAMVVTIIASAWFTRQEIPNLPQPNPDEQGDGGLRELVVGSLGSVVSSIVTAFENASFRWLFSGVLVVYMMVGIDISLNTYINQYFWELSGRDFVLLGVCYPLGLFAGALFTRRFHARFGKRPALVFGTAGWATLQVLPIVLRLLDWFPANESALLVPTLVGLRMLQGAVVQQSTVSYGSMMADVVDEHELLTGKRQEGIFFGASAFSAKASVGLGTMVAGFALSWIGWPTGQEIRTAADVAPETVAALGIVFGPVVCGFAVLSVWCYSRYGLDAARHREILQELARVRPERRAAAAAHAAARRTAIESGTVGVRRPATAG